MSDALVILLALLCSAIPFWMGERYGAVRLVSPMHLLSYFCCMGFLVKVVVFSYAPEFAFYSRFIEKPGALLTGTLYLSGFVVALCIGYRIAVRPFQETPSIDAARRIAAGLRGQTWLFFAAFAIAALTVFLILQARGHSLFSAGLLERLNEDKQIDVNAEGVGSTLAGIKTLFVVPKFVFVLLLAHGMVARRVWTLVQAAVLAGLLVFIALMSGDRFELVELLVYSMAVYMICGGRLGVRSVFIIMTGATAVLLLSAYMTALRGSDAGLLQQVVGSTYFLDINASVMVTDRVTPEMYLWGGSYGWWSFGWVPRAIWIEKPAIDLGVFLKRDVMGVATGGAFNVTGPGEAFMNFGWAGPGVGVVLGWLYRKGEVLLLSPRYTLRFGSCLFYPILFYPFVQATLQSSFSAFIVGAVAQAVLIAFLITLSVPRYRLFRLPTQRQGGFLHA